MHHEISFLVHTFGWLVWISVVLVFMQASENGSFEIRRALQPFLAIPLRPFFVLWVKWSRRHSSDYITAYRWAFLKVSNDPEHPVRFKPLRKRHPPFDTTSEAVCARKHPRNHVAPADDCECGFYALDRARHLGWVNGSVPFTHGWKDRGRVLLQVDLSGELIRGSLGYRAQYQRVLNVVVQNRCATCHDPDTPSTLEWWRRRRRATGLMILAKRVIPICDQCYPRSQHQPLSWLAEQLGTEVVWAERSLA